MKYGLPLMLLLLLSACNTTPQKETKANKPLKGEFAFLLQYNGKLPEDVGFLTNHIVERRLANILKDRFQDFMAGTQCGKPIVVDGSTIHSVYVDCNNDTLEVRRVDIDVADDVVWVSIISPERIEGFTDDNTVPVPDR